MTANFRALEVSETEGKFRSSIIDKKIDDLPEGIEAIEAPMQGLMVSFNVKTGDKVWVGKTIAIMEAMKMEHRLRSPRDGIISRITSIEIGGQVKEGEIMFELEDE